MYKVFIIAPLRYMRLELDLQAIGVCGAAVPRGVSGIGVLLRKAEYEVVRLGDREIRSIDAFYELTRARQRDCLMGIEAAMSAMGPNRVELVISKFTELQALDVARFLSRKVGGMRPEPLLLVNALDAAGRELERIGSAFGEFGFTPAHDCYCRLMEGSP